VNFEIHKELIVEIGRVEVALICSIDPEHFMTRLATDSENDGVWSSRAESRIITVLEVKLYHSRFRHHALKYFDAELWG